MRAGILAALHVHVAQRKCAESRPRLAPLTEARSTEREATFAGTLRRPRSCAVPFFSLSLSLSLPQAKIGVMGGEQASGVLSQVVRDNKERAGDDWSAEEEETFRAPIREKFDHEASVYYASARLWDDGVIEPRDTRNVLGLSLAAALNEQRKETKFGVFRM